MRKKLIGLLLSTLLFSGCNMPSQSAVVTPTHDLVGTQVSQRLTATARVALPQDLTIVPTQGSAQPTRTVLAATATVPATATPSVTSTPTQATSQTSTATATGIPGDPRTALGDPTWKDTFQKASAWGLSSAYDDGHTRVSIDSGKMSLKSYDGNGWHGWRIVNTKIQNFYLEATIKPLTCSGNDQYGLIFRTTSDFKGYWFGLTCDGQYSLQSGDIYEFTDIVKAKSNANIHSGANQVNRLGVNVNGNKISLYANGKLLEDVTSDAYASTGTFGYFISGNKTPGFTFETTEIDYWILP